MTTTRAFWDAIAIARAKHALTVTPPDDDLEMGDDDDDDIGDELADREDQPGPEAA